MAVSSSIISLSIILKEICSKLVIPKPLMFNFLYRVTLMLNDVSVLSIGGSNDTTASNSILLPLNARDRVWIELSQGKLVEPYQFTDSQYNGPKKSGYTSFIGYLIGEISQVVISDTIDFEYDDNHNQGKFVLLDWRAKITDMFRISEGFVCTLSTAYDNSYRSHFKPIPK